MGASVRAMHPAVPIVLTLLVLGALAKAKRPQVDYVIGSQLWAPPPTADQAAALLRKKAPKYRIYQGMPEMQLPPGFELVPLQYSEDGTSYLNPLRFVQYQETAHLEDLQSTFTDVFTFGVAEGGKLDFYAVAKPVEDWQCCRMVSCGREDEWEGIAPHHWDYNEQWGKMVTGRGGSPGEWAKTLGPGWDCACAEIERGGCYTAVVPPRFGHLLVRNPLNTPNLGGLSNG